MVSAVPHCVRRISNGMTPPSCGRGLSDQKELFADLDDGRKTAAGHLHVKNPHRCRFSVSRRRAGAGPQKEHFSA